MASQLHQLCNRLNSPATVADYFLGFVLLASLLSLDMTAIRHSSNPGFDELASRQTAVSMNESR